MTLSNKELKSIISGAIRFDETEDGYLHPQQYTKEQIDYFKSANTFWYERSTASNAKTMEIKTDADSVSFEYKIIWIGSPDSVELAVDGSLTEILYVKDLPKEGTISFTLPKGQKLVTVYLPVDATMVVRNFTIDGVWHIKDKRERILWLGDSITQGYGPLRSAQSYVSVANRILGCSVVNQGIGSYVYDKNAITPIPGYNPDKIVVAMGTNQHSVDSRKTIEEYYDMLATVYGSTPVLCITPIWRGDIPNTFNMLLKIREDIEAVCKGYPNITVVDGFKLVPHLNEYFIDKLHPNALGCEIYGRNLAHEMIRLGFVDKK